MWQTWLLWEGTSCHSSLHFNHEVHPQLPPQTARYCRDIGVPVSLYIPPHQQLILHNQLNQVLWCHLYCSLLRDFYMDGSKKCIQVRKTNYKLATISGILLQKRGHSNICCTNESFWTLFMKWSSKGQRNRSCLPTSVAKTQKNVLHSGSEGCNWH